MGRRGDTTPAKVEPSGGRRSGTVSAPFLAVPLCGSLCFQGFLQKREPPVHASIGVVSVRVRRSLTFFSGPRSSNPFSACEEFFTGFYLCNL